MPVSPICRRSSCPTHGADHHAAGLSVYPSSSTADAQWVILKPLLPPAGNTTDKDGPQRSIPDASPWMRSSTWPAAGSPGARCPATSRPR